MSRVVKIFKNKLLLSLSKGFKIKIDKNNYMLFKKEEDYNILFYLERIFFDFITYRAKLLNADWFRQRAFFLNFPSMEGKITRS